MALLCDECNKLKNAVTNHEPMVTFGVANSLAACIHMPRVLPALVNAEW